MDEQKMIRLSEAVNKMLTELDPNIRYALVIDAHDGVATMGKTPNKSIQDLVDMLAYGAVALVPNTTMSLAEVIEYTGMVMLKAGAQLGVMQQELYNSASGSETRAIIDKMKGGN